MTSLSETILKEFQVRKTTAQKTAFIKLMQAHFPGLETEKEGRIFTTRNLVLGDVKQARLVLCAHYDTCAQLPFPNFIAPQNLGLYLVLAALIFLLSAAASYAMFQLNLSPYFAMVLALLFLVIFQLWMLFGKANPHTANDNTSGVVTLCETALALSAEEREKVAFVFFDHEELGLIGSSRFHKRYQDTMKNKLLINFDCVSDGDCMLFCQSKKAHKQDEDILKTVFCSQGDKQMMFAKPGRAFYPSDQIHFPRSVAVAGLHKKPLIGLYMSRIHTKHDTVFQTKNIEQLAIACKQLIQKSDEFE